MPYKMPNGAWAIPFSCAFVMKDIRDFVATECSIDVCMTIVMRMKFTKCHRKEEVMDFVKEKLKCRVNEEEDLMMNPEDESRIGKYNEVKSASWVDGDDLDML